MASNYKFHMLGLVWLTFTDVSSININVPFNVVIGTNGAEINCSISKDKENIKTVFIAYSNSSNDIFLVKFNKSADGQNTSFTQQGKYLSSRVTLLNPTSDLSTVHMRFNEIRCEDSGSYRCTAVDAEFIPISSVKKIITITSPSFKLDNITSEALTSVITDGQVISFICHGNVGNPPGNITWRKCRHVDPNCTIYNDIYTVQTYDEEKCAYYGKSNLTIQLQFEDNNSIVECGEKSNISNNRTLRSKPLRIKCPPEKPLPLTPNTTILTFNENQNASFGCEGKVGNPAGKIVWQKVIDGQNVFLNVSNDTTCTTKMKNSCSFYAISNVTVQLSYLDHRAIIICKVEAEDSQYLGMLSQSTVPINVHFGVREIAVKSIPKLNENQQYNNVILQCNATGNPPPMYTWYEQAVLDHMILSRNATVTVIKKGIYICTAENSFDGFSYIANEKINITSVDGGRTTQGPSPVNATFNYLSYTFAILSGVVVLLVAGVFYRRRKKMSKRRNSDVQMLHGTFSSTDDKGSEIQLAGTYASVKDARRIQEQSKSETSQYADILEVSNRRKNTNIGEDVPPMKMDPYINTNPFRVIDQTSTNNGLAEYAAVDKCIRNEETAQPRSVSDSSYESTGTNEVVQL